MYEMHQWNMGPGSYGFAQGVGAPEWLLALVALAAPIVLLIVLWSVFWKGLALWHAARRGQYWWFVALLIINTAGILEIIYLFFVAKLGWKDLFSINNSHHSHDGHAHH